jgi:hypothetical protein
VKWLGRLLGGGQVAKYVVLFNQVRHDFTRGDVVDGARLGGDLPRYLEQRAVRPATEDEARLERVTIEAPGRPTHSLDAQLAEKERDLARMAGRNADLMAENGRLRAVIAELEAKVAVGEAALARARADAKKERKEAKAQAKAEQAPPPAAE